MYDNFKYFGKRTENRVWSVIIHQGSLSFFENGTTVVCFQRVRKIRCGKMNLKVNLRTGIKIYEKSFTIKAGRPSSPADSEGAGVL